jgi:MFS family permease
LRSEDVAVQGETKEIEATAQVPEELTGQPRRVLVGRVILARTFSALKHRNFRLFFVGQLISLMGTWMQNTALSWLVYQLTGSKVLLGVVAASSTAPMLFFSAYGGSIADRFPKRKIVLGTQSLMMILAFVLAGLTYTQFIQPSHIILISALGGLAMAFDMPARQAFLVEITSREDLLNAVSLNSAIVNGARVVGPAVAGLVMGGGGAAFCFLLNGISFVAVIVGLLLMRLHEHAHPDRHRKKGHMKEGFSYVLHHRRLRRIFTLFAIVGIFGWSYSVLMPAFATDVLKIDEHKYGLLLGANGLGALTGALLTAAFGGTFKPRQIAFTGLYLFAAMLEILSFWPTLGISMICLALGGVGMMLFFSTINTVIQTSVADEMRGRVMGIWAVVFGGMMPLGSLQAGTLAHYLGVPRTVGLGAAICALAGIVTWYVSRDLAADASAS